MIFMDNILRYIKVFTIVSFFCVPISTFAKESNDISIIKLQIYLTSAGFPVGKIDGLYGRKTDQAIKSLLSKHGIVWDGILDEKDISIIRKEVIAASYIYEPNAENRFYFDLQEQLIIAGYLEQGFTAQYDPQTETAVLNFIQKNNLSKQNLLRDDLPTYALLKSLHRINRDAASIKQAFVKGQLNRPEKRNLQQPSQKTEAKKNKKPIDLASIKKRSFTKVHVACEGTAKGDIKSQSGMNYVNPGPFLKDYYLKNNTTTFFKLDQNSYNNCGNNIKDKDSKSWEKSKARAELNFAGVKARKGYTYVFDSEFLYERTARSTRVANLVNDRTLIFQIKADPNPKCGPIVALKIHGWKGKTSLEVNSTYIEIDENFSYARNTGGKITCHQWDSKFLPIDFSENKAHHLRVELSVLDYNKYEIHVFINRQHVRKISYDYQAFPHKVHKADGFYLPFGLYQMPNKFRSNGQHLISAQFKNVGFYEIRTAQK